MKADFISPEIEAKKAKQCKMQRLYDNDLGKQFENIDENRQSDTQTVLFKLEKSLKKKKADWTKNITLTTNYFKAICGLYSTFAIGGEVNYYFPEGEEKGKKFRDFWEGENMDLVFEDNHKLSLATGLDGVMLSKLDGEVKVANFGWNEFYPEGHPVSGYSNTEANFMWTLSDVFEDGDEYRYVMRVRKKNGKWYIQHKAYKSAPYRIKKNGEIEFGEEAPAVLDEIGIQGLGEDGVEPVTYNSIPYCMLQSPELDPLKLGESVLADILPQIQALYFFHTLIMLESESNMLSKLAIPISMIPTDEEGNPMVGNTEFIAFSDQGEIPQFIVKNVDFDYIFKEIEKILEQISLQTGIPVELLSSEGKGGQ